MKVLVFGANGMAGHMIATYLCEKGYDVTGFAKQDLGICKYIIGDALDKNAVKEVLEKEEYDVVINAIGVLNKAVDANLADGIYLNSVFPHYLVNCLQDKKTKVIHISSDCVFSGTRGAYEETMQPDADSYYGKTKALGEINDHKNLTMRTSIVGPEIKSDGIGLFHWFMSQTGIVNGFTEVIWSGVTTLELAKAIEAAIHQNVTGLYHLVNNQTINKHDLLVLFNKFINDSKTVIHENGSFSSDKSLVNSRNDFNYQVPSYEQMIQEMGTWMKNHMSIYEQYYC